MMTINIHEGSVINSSNVLLVPTIDSEVCYKYVGKVLAQKPSNFTGVGVVMHIYTYNNKYLFTTAGFVSGFKFRYLKFQGMNVSKGSLWNPILSGALTNILNKDNAQYSELREKLISYFRLNRMLYSDQVYLRAYFDYYIYRNDRIIGLYRLVEQEAYITKSDPDLTSNGLYEAQFLLNFETNGRLTFKLFDATDEPKAFDYEQLQVHNTTLYVKMSANNNKLTLSSYFKLENFNLSSAKSSLLPLVINEVSKPIAFCRVRLDYKLYDTNVIQARVYGLSRSAAPVSNSPELVLPLIFSALSTDSDIIDVGGAFPLSYSRIDSQHRRLIPLAKSDLLDIDNGLAMSQYDEYIERYKRYGLGLYSKVYLSDQCVITGIDASNKVRKIYGYYFTSGSANEDIFMYDNYANTYLAKPFSGYFVNLETRNPSLKMITVSGNDVAVTFADIVHSKSQGYMRFNVNMLNYNVFYAGIDDFVVTKVPEPFEIKQVYLAYTEKECSYYIPSSLGFDKQFSDFVWSLYVACPHALHMLPDFKFDNFTTILEDERKSILSSNNVLMSYIISSNAFDISDSYSPITASYLDYSAHNSLLRLYNLRYNNDNSKYSTSKPIPAVEIKHLIVDNSVLFEKLVEASC